MQYCFRRVQSIQTPRISPSLSLFVSALWPRVPEYNQDIGLDYGAIVYVENIQEGPTQSIQFYPLLSLLQNAAHVNGYEHEDKMTGYCELRSDRISALPTEILQRIIYMTIDGTLDAHLGSLNVVSLVSVRFNNQLAEGPLHKLRDRLVSLKRLRLEHPYCPPEHSSNYISRLGRLGLSPEEAVMVAGRAVDPQSIKWWKTLLDFQSPETQQRVREIGRELPRRSHPGSPEVKARFEDSEEYYCRLRKANVSCKDAVLLATGRVAQTSLAVESMKIREGDRTISFQTWCPREGGERRKDYHYRLLLIYNELEY